MWGHIKVLNGFMVGIRTILPIILLAGLSVSAIEQYSDNIDPLLEVESSTEQSAEAPKVTAVYGVSTDDYLPMKEVARQHLRPNLRKGSSRVAFDLPDAFYFIGGPIFLLIFLRVLVIFLNGFEEKRKEEMRVVASEHTPGEHILNE